MPRLVCDLLRCYDFKVQLGDGGPCREKSTPSFYRFFCDANVSVKWWCFFFKKPRASSTSLSSCSRHDVHHHHLSFFSCYFSSLLLLLLLRFNYFSRTFFSACILLPYARSLEAMFMLTCFFFYFLKKYDVTYV